MGGKQDWVSWGPWIVLEMEMIKTLIYMRNEWSRVCVSISMIFSKTNKRM